MTTNVPARHRQRVDRDPDRRRPAHQHPGFVELAPEMLFDVCRLCSCVVPASDRARENHTGYHERNDKRGPRNDLPD